MNERGIALIAALAIIMVLLPLGAFVVFQCRTDLMIQHNLRAATEAFYVAEAGLEHAIAEIPLGRSFDGILAGPDRVAGTADDGLFPFAGGAPSAFPSAPFRYDVRAAMAGDGMVSVASTGHGVDGATRVVAALVARAPLPATPAALYAESDVAVLDLGAAGFLLSGFDHRAGDPPGAATGTGAPVPAVGSTRADAAAALRQHLSEAEAQRLTGAGEPPSIATTPALDLQAYAASFAAHPLRVDLAPADIGGNAVIGTAGAPQLTVVAGDLVVSGQLSGSGVVVVRGSLQVTGTLSFTGLVLVMGALICESSSTLTVYGGFWRGASVDERLALQGAGAIAYSSAALAGVDAVFPGLLPRAAIVAGWQEQM